MSCDEGVEEVGAVFAFECDDFAAGSAYVGVDVECFPEVIYGGGTRHGTDVEENADVGLEDRTKSVEEPSVGVDLFLILFFETEDDLNGDDALFGSFDFERGSDGYLNGVFVNVGCDVVCADLGLCDAFLVATHGGEDAEGSRVDFGTTVADDTNDYFFPAVFAPSFASVAFTEMGDVFYDAVHGTSEEFLVFVVHGHDNEEFGTTRRVVVDLTEGEAIVFEVVWIASGCGITHMSEFAF